MNDQTGSRADQTSLWDIPRLPFIFKPLTSPHNPPGIPDELPFHLGIEPATGRLLQRSTADLEAILARAYADGSLITGMMDESGIGRQYADDFLSVIAAGLGTARLDGMRVLEIGSGTGYLLHRLRELGATVQGVEPGPGAEEAARRYAIPIERAFFPNVDVGDGYDVGLLHLLLEHVPDPGSILRSVGGIVRNGGRVFVAVQDEEPYIRSGELSLLFHEHYSYFTSRTLAGLIEQNGGTSVRVARSAFTNLLVADYVVGPSSAPSDRATAEDLELCRAFRLRAEAATSAVWTVIDNARSRGGTVGIFVPARAVNMLSMREDGFEAIRFFDDDPGLRDTYFPGINVRVESRDDLFRSPPSVVLIMSLSFGKRIRDAIQPRLGPEVEITLLGDILPEPS